MYSGQENMYFLPLEYKHILKIGGLMVPMCELMVYFHGMWDQHLQMYSVPLESKHILNIGGLMVPMFDWQLWQMGPTPTVSWEQSPIILCATVKQIKKVAAHALSVLFYGSS